MNDLKIVQEEAIFENMYRVPGIPYYMKDEYKEILKNSCNYYWTFYYEKHHSNGVTIFFMGVYLPDYNYLYLYEDEYLAKHCHRNTQGILLLLQFHL